MYGAPPVPHSAETAKLLILIGLVFQAIEVVVVFLLGLAFVVAPFFLFSFLLLFVGLIGLVWIVLVYLFSYERVARGDYSGARTPTLVFAVLSLLTFHLLSGILYLIAYAELETAEREQAARWHGGYPGSPGFFPAGPPAAPSPGPSSFAAPAGPPKYCSYCGRANPNPARYCQGCGAAFP